MQTRYAADAPISGSAMLSFINRLGRPLKLDDAPSTIVLDVGLPEGARSLRWNLTCRPTGACQFPDEYPLFANKSRLDLNEPVNPTLTVTGGTLAGAGAKAGGQSLAFDAAGTYCGVVKTTRGGRFRWRYRFSRGAAGRTFAIRVRVDSPVYPFAPGDSKPIFVRVR